MKITVKKIFILAILISLCYPLITWANIPYPYANERTLKHLDYFYRSNVIFYLLITLILEILFTLLFLNFFKISSKIKILLGVILANLISYPIFVYFSNITMNWFTIMAIEKVKTLTFSENIGLLDKLAILVLEILVVVFESIIIYIFSRKIISYKKTILLSLSNNIFSLLVGLIYSYAIYNLNFHPFL